MFPFILIGKALREHIEAQSDITSSLLILIDGLDGDRKDGILILDAENELFKMKFDGCVFFKAGVDLIHSFLTSSAIMFLTEIVNFGIKHLMLFIDNVFGSEGVRCYTPAMNEILKHFSTATTDSDSSDEDNNDN